MEIERLRSLNQLVAGVAHELNNPAAAINRISAELLKRLSKNYGLTKHLLEHGVNPAHVQSMQELAKAKEQQLQKNGKPGTMQLMEKEDEIIDWMEKNKFPDDRSMAEAFSEFGFSCADLDQIMKTVG